MLELFGNLAVHPGGGGILLRRIGESAQPVELNLPHKVHQTGKLLVRFAGEAHDEGGAQSEAHLPGPVQQLPGLLRVAPAVHALQKQRVGMLQGQIQIFADVVMARHGVQQLFVDLVRVAVEHPQPFHAGDLRRALHQLRQLGMPHPVDAEAGGILRHQHMLSHALFRQCADLVQHVLHFPGTEAAPNQRNGAVGAAVVAAVGNADIGGIRRGGQHPASGQDSIIPAAEALALAVQGLVQRFRQAGILADAHQQVDLRHISH